MSAQDETNLIKTFDYEIHLIIPVCTTSCFRLPNEMTANKTTIKTIFN